MTIDTDLLRAAVQADIDVAISRLCLQQISPLNILISGLLLAVESDEKLRNNAIKYIAEMLENAESTNRIDSKGTAYVELVVDMLSRRTVAKEYLQTMRDHLEEKP